MPAASNLTGAYIPIIQGGINKKAASSLFNTGGGFVLTTIGNSGSAIFSGGILNIPTYTLAGLGGINFSSLSAVTPLSYNSGTGNISFPSWPSNTSGVLTNDGSGNLTWGSAGTTYTADELTLHLSGTQFSIKSTYPGQSSITTTGTLVSGSTGTGFTLDFLNSTQSGKIALAHGGTNADLSVTGGAANYLKQSSSGAAITVGTIPYTDITGAPPLTGFVPYSGATTDVDLGSHNFQTTGSIGTTGTRVLKGWFTDLQVTNTIIGSISGNAATVTTNANLTGDVTSTGNVTTISTGAVTDDKASLLVKPAVAVVSVSNLTLSGEQTIDGQLTSTSLVLLTAQTTGSENGPWVTAAGAWSRPTWYTNGSITQAPRFLTTFIRLGTTYQGTTWRMTTASVIIGTTATTWVETPLVLNSLNLSGILPILNGGTSQSTYTTGDQLIATATNILSKLAIGSSAQMYLVNSGLPSWQTMSGDATISNTGGLTFATVNGNVGTFGSTTTSLTVTVNGKGLITSISSQTVTPAVGSITGLGTGVNTALEINVGTSGSFVVNGGSLGTPATGVGTNITGIPISTGLTGGVATRIPVFTSVTALSTYSTFVFDGTNLGIGAIPQSILSVSSQITIQAPVSGSTAQFVGLDANPLRLTFDTHNNSSTAGTAFMGRRSRGTAGSPSALSSGDDIISFNGRGYGTTGYAAASTGLIVFKANQTFTDTNMGTYASTYTTPDNSVTASEALRVTGSGVINAIQSGGKYQINSTDVLNSTTLGSGIITSSLTSFGNTPTIVTPSITTGFTIGGVATNGKFIVGNGTNYIPSTSTIPTSAGATANKALISDGTNYVLAGVTEPNSTTTGDIPYASSTNVYSNLASNSSATKKYLQTVSSGVPSYQQIDFADLSGTSSMWLAASGVTMSGNNVITQASNTLTFTGGNKFFSGTTTQTATFTVTSGVTVANSDAITVSSTTGINVGDGITGTNITGTALIRKITDGTHLRISDFATASSSSITFTIYPSANGTQFDQSVGAANYTSAGIFLKPTLTGGNNACMTIYDAGANVGLRILGNAASTANIELVNANVTSGTENKWQIGTSVANGHDYLNFINNNPSAARTFSFSNDGLILDGNSAIITQSANGSISINGTQSGSANGTQIKLQGNSVSLSAGNADNIVVDIGSTSLSWIPTTGQSKDWYHLRIKSTINMNSGATGNLYGIDYNPTITALGSTSVHYGILVRPATLSGVGGGATLPTATWQINGSGTNTTLKTIGAGTGTNYSIRSFQSDGTTEIFSLLDNGLVTFGATTAIKGTGTNNNATAGNIGEEFNSVVSTYTNYTTTATYQNIASITLTAGDWDISAVGTFSSNGATITAASNAIFVVSTTTASASGATEGVNIIYVPQSTLLGTSLESVAIPSYRASISGSTTYYLNTQATFTIGNPQFVGSIRARRRR